MRISNKPDRFPLMPKKLKHPLIKSFATPEELKRRDKFFHLFQQSPIPQHELLQNLPLYIRRQDLRRLLFIHELYTMALPVHGIVIEFGIRWGRNLALFESFRGIYEPYNVTRKIVGFDTFSGFSSVHAKDGHSDIVKKNAYSTTKNYQSYLESILNYHESESPISHLKKFELVKGDASLTIKKYLNKHPETIIALAYFDMDLYKPTKDCLQAIKPHLVKGSVLGFDELNKADWPGETRALNEVLGLNNLSLKRSPFSTYQSYIVFD